jgi:hypothetical protein
LILTSHTLAILTAYYYPTAKKRYLPRIQRVTTDIINIPTALQTGDWMTVEGFLPVAENAILPLYLYQSSLDGQGLRMANSYAQQMKSCAEDYEKAYKRLATATKAHSTDKALSALTDMGVAVVEYRQLGRLTEESDGAIPSVDEIRRMTMRRPTVKVVEF